MSILKLSPFILQKRRGPCRQGCKLEAVWIPPQDGIVSARYLQRLRLAPIREHLAVCALNAAVLHFATFAVIFVESGAELAVGDDYYAALTSRPLPRQMAIVHS